MAGHDRTPGDYPTRSRNAQVKVRFSVRLFPSCTCKDQVKAEISLSASGPRWGARPAKAGPRRAGRKGTVRTRRRDDFAATVAVNGPSNLSHVRRANAAEVRAGPGVAEV